jgi:hypothetical protein
MPELMANLFAMAAPLSLPNRFVAAGLGMLLCSLLLRLSGAPPSRMLPGLILPLLIAAAGLSILVGDRLGVTAFLGGCFGAALLHLSRPKGEQVQRVRRIELACLLAGPLVGVGLFVLFHLLDVIPALDVLHALTTCVLVGSLAGFVVAGIFVTFTGDRKG